MDWVTASALAISMAFFIAVLLDMLARAFNLQSLSAWVKSEYMQVGVSVLLLAFAMGMATAGNAMVAGIAHDIAAQTNNIELRAASAEADPVLIAKSYLRSVVECQSKIYYLLFSINVFAEPASTISLEVRGYESIAGGYAFGGIASTLKLLGGGIVQLALFEYVQYYLLHFAQYAMLGVFFPIGLVLRAFPLTRGAGGLIVAFSLGFAFVFPMTYVLIVAMTPNLGNFCSTVVVEEPDYPCYYNEGQVMENVIMLEQNVGEINRDIDRYQGLLSLMYLQAFFYPLIALIVTFTFIRQTASLFGADLAEIGRGIIKII